MEGSQNVGGESWVTGVLAGIGVIVWLVRLEGKVNHNTKLIEYDQKRVDMLSSKLEAFDSKIMDELASLRESVARIEGYLRKTQEGDNKND